MHIFSYKTRIFLSLFLLLSSVISLLLAVISKSSAFIILLSSAAGLFAADFITQRFSLRHTAFCGSFFAMTGICFILFTNVLPINFFGYILLGFSAGQLLLFVPGVSLILWFRHLSKLQSASVWIFSALCGGLAGLSSWILPGVTLLLTSLGLFSGSFLIKDFPCRLKDPYKDTEIFAAFRKSGKYFYFRLFIFFSSISTGLTFSCISPYFASPANYIFIIIGAAICPVIALLFLNKKGVFAPLLFLIFAEELCVFFALFSENSPLMRFAALFFFGGTLTLSPYLYTVLYHYIFGASEVSSRLARAFIFIPIGLITSIFIAPSGNELIVLTFLTIICSFFAVFSAWNHRLTLLKSS